MSSNKPEIYNVGNPWQKKVYRKMSDYLENNFEIDDYGKTRNDNKYKHLLTEKQSEFNFINKEIFNATKERFKKHKAGDLTRILTNTAASQTYCFNLVIHLNLNKELASKLFSELLNKKVKVIHIEPEFTPNECNDIIGFENNIDESIGDQNLKLGIGTDADVAIFYTYENSKKGILLIEYKFIEAEFSTCTSYMKKKDLKTICNSNSYYDKLIKTKDSLCGYNKYHNWNLNKISKVIDNSKIEKLQFCPFRLGLNQLWRNMLLAEQVSKSRDCNEFGFWVLSPKENYKYLWKSGKTEEEFREILTIQGNNSFKNIYLESILEKIDNYDLSTKDRLWIEELNKKYKI